MKIFLVCNSLGGGGAERVHVNLANGFAQRGHEVYLIADVNQPVSYPVDEQVHVLPLCPLSSNKFVKWGKAVLWLRKYVKQYKPDVVIVNMHLCSLFSNFATIGTGIPVVLTIHNALERPSSYQVNRITIFCDEYLSRIYKRTTVLTVADYKYLRSRKNLIVMPNPISFPSVQSISSKDNVILSACRLDSWHVKGFDLLIKAWGGLMRNEVFRKNNLGWRLQIAGTGNEESVSYLKQLCKEQGIIDTVDFLGYVYDMQTLYKKSSVYVLSSRSEGFPMVLIEAMSQGCACIATDFKGRTKDIIRNNDEGIICPTDDILALSNAMKSLLMNEKFRKSLQERAAIRSNDFSVENVIEKWEKVLGEMI